MSEGHIRLSHNLNLGGGAVSQVGKEQLGSLVHDDAGVSRLTGVLGKGVGNMENCSISPYLP